MRFLVVTKPQFPIPPEAVDGLLHELAGWASKWTSQGKLEQVWGFAGFHGIGGIFKVDSLEDLDAVISEFPFWIFSVAEITPLISLDDRIQRDKEARQATDGRLA